MTVRITENFLNEVKNNIKKKHISATEAEFGSSNHEIPVDFSDIAFVDNVLWGKYLPLKATTPAEWCNAFDVGPDRYRKLIEVSIAKGGLTFSLHPTSTIKNYTLPPDKREFTTYMLVSGRHPKIDEMIAEFKLRTKLSEKWRDTKEKVIAFLKSCRSLNHAITVWPEVKSFIPKDIIETMERSAETKQKEKAAKSSNPEDVLKTIDTSALVGDLVALRFATGN